MQTVYKSNFGELPAVFRQYADFQHKELSDVLIDRAAKLSTSDFGNGVIGLYQAGREIMPTAEELFSLPIRLGWHIKRRNRPVFTLYETRTSKRGKTAGQTKEFRRKNKQTKKNINIGEIEKRYGRRGYHAAGWLNANLLRYAGSSKQMPGVQGEVTLVLSGDILSVKIVNGATESEKVVQEHGDYVQRILELHAADMLAYVDRKISEENGKSKLFG